MITTSIISKYKGDVSKFLSTSRGKKTEHSQKWQKIHKKKNKIEIKEYGVVRRIYSSRKAPSNRQLGLLDP